MSKQSDLAKSTLILGLGKLSTQFSAFILLPIYTVFLSPDQFGMADLIASYVALLAPLIMIQLDRASFRFLVDARGDEEQTKRVISNTLRIVLISGSIAGLLFAVISIFWQAQYGALIVGAIVAAILSGLLLQFARGFGKNKYFAIASIITAVTNLLVSVGLVVLLKMGVEGVLWALVVSNVAAVLYLAIALKMHRYVSFSQEYNAPAIRKELIEFAWPLVPSALSWWFIRTFDRTLIAIFIGVAANGIYAAANKYSLILMALYSIFDLSWTESASANINSKDRNKFFSGVYNSSFRFFGAIGLVMIVATPYVFNILIGSEFQEAYLYIPILLLGALFNAAVSQYSVVYIAKKETKQVLVTSIVAAIISIILNVTLIPLVGIMGAAIAVTLTFFIMAIWRHFDIKKYVTITFTGHLFLKFLGLYTIALILYYINNPYLNIINLVVMGMVALFISKGTLVSGIRPILSKIRR